MQVAGLARLQERIVTVPSQDCQSSPLQGAMPGKYFCKNSLQFSFLELKQMMILKSRKMFVLCKIYFHAQSEDSS